MIKEILEKQLGKVVKDLQTELANQNVNASGSLSRSLEVQIIENDTTIQGIVLANRYIGAVDKGRGPTKNFTGGLLQAIKQWVKLGKYGIDPNNKGIAYAITKNITKQGSYLFRNNINKNIVGNVVNQNKIDSIAKALEQESIKIISKDFKL